MISKKEILDHLNLLIDNKIEEITNTINSFMESRDLDTKSSAGDKYETGRAMIQMEIEQSQLQLQKTQQLKHELSKVDPDIESGKVDIGSLIDTGSELYFIAIGMGKITVEGKEVFVISLASPLGTNLKGKQQDDTVEFQERKIKINKLI